MTEPHHDLPGAPSERPLVDGQISRLYRQHARAEPPAAVDQHILAAARAAVVEQARVARQPVWWLRWRTPLALATTLVLTLTLSLIHEQQPKEAPPTFSDERALSAKRSDDGRPPSAVQAMPAAPPAPTVAPPAGATVAPAAEGGKEGVREQNASGPTNDHALRQRANRVENGPALPAAAALSEDKAAGAAKSESQSASSPAPASRGPASVQGEGVLAQDVAAVDAAPAEAEVRSEATDARPAAVWLDEIRALRRAGKSAEAERQLAAFRRAHPNFRLPKEFRQ